MCYTAIAMIQFSRTLVDEFYKSRKTSLPRLALRTGQDFFNYFSCHKVTGSQRILLDRLYELDGTAADLLISSMIDHNQ